MTYLADQHDGFRYLLTVIDVFSKYAFAVAFKKKDAKSVVEAFEKVLAEGRKPLKLQIDKGKEFVNESFLAKLRAKGIQYYTSQNEDVKCSVVERFNRTLKTKMWKYFTHRNTYRFIDVLSDMIYSYNRSYHRTIGRAPADVSTENADDVRKIKYGGNDNNSINSKNKFKIGDLVRISKTRRTFEKEYLPNWTEEIFTVDEAKRTNPPTYKLADYGGEIIEGTFYDHELQRVIKRDDIYKIEKILRTRRRGSNKEYFVKWRGYPDKFNSWVNETSISNVI